MKRHEYSMADVVKALKSGKVERVAEVARFFPTLTAAALSDPLSLALAFGDKGAITGERKIKEVFGIETKGEDEPAPADKGDGDDEKPKPKPKAKDDDGDEDAPKPKPKPKKDDDDEPAPSDEKPKKKGDDKGGKKGEDDLDALLNELDDDKPSKKGKDDDDAGDED